MKDSLFEIGSITKVFTATLLANQLIDKKIKPKSLVNKAFPYKFNNKIKLNYVSLANHTAGIYRIPSNLMPLMYKNPDNPYVDYTYDLLDEYLKNEMKLETKDSVKYSYSNLGAGILSYALSKKQNQSFEILLEKKVFDKYEMDNTSYEFPPSFSGISYDGYKTDNWSFNALKGAGGLVSNVNDLSKFVLAQFQKENKELTLSRTATHKISDKMSIGLGWHIIEPDSENEKYWHNGGTGGFTSSVSFRTNNSTGVIVLSNISPMSQFAGSIDEICFELLDLLK